MISTILNILLFIFILGVLVLVHELGHFLTAKKSGVFIYEFSIGMGPVLKTIKGKDGINYSIRALPIGGFVQMAGEIYEDDDTNKIPKEKFMCNRPWWQRLIILVAGVFNNFLLALILLFVIALIWGAPSQKPTLTGITKDSAALEIGMQAGDTLKEVNGHKVDSWDVAQLYLIMNNKDSKYNVEIKHSNGKISKKSINPNKSVEVKAGDTIFKIKNKKVSDPYIYLLAYKETTVKIERDGTVLEYTVKPHEDLKLSVGDVIKEISNDTPLYLAVRDNYSIEVLHNDGNTQSYVISPKIKVNKKGQITKEFGFEMQAEVKKGFVPAVKYAFSKFGSLMKQMWLTLSNLFTGGISVDMLSGPVGIYTVVGETRKSGIENVIFLIAYLSINLGIMNILPIPALDGGHVLFLLIELITRKKVNEKVEGIATTIFFGLLLLLMFYVTINDVIRLIL